MNPNRTSTLPSPLRPEVMQERNRQDRGQDKKDTTMQINGEGRHKGPVCVCVCGGGGPTLACPGSMVGYEASTAGLRLCRTHLTGVTPGPAHRGTAEGLGAHDARQLSLAHLVAHRGKAGSSPVVFTTHNPGRENGINAFSQTKCMNRK